MKAIVTKRHGNYRIRATAEGVSACIIDQPDNATNEEEHHAAARELCRRMSWPGYLIGGGLPDGQSMAWTFLPREHPTLMTIRDLIGLDAEIEAKIGTKYPHETAEAIIKVARRVLADSRAVAEGVL